MFISQLANIQSIAFHKLKLFINFSKTAKCPVLNKIEVYFYRISLVNANFLS